MFVDTLTSRICAVIKPLSVALIYAFELKTFLETTKGQNLSIGEFSSQRLAERVLIAQTATEFETAQKRLSTPYRINTPPYHPPYHYILWINASHR